VGEVRVPLWHEPGVEAEVDWGEAGVVLGGVLMTVYLFLVRACFSGAWLVAAFSAMHPAGVPGGARGSV
jgi:hypothetical protein